MLSQFKNFQLDRMDVDEMVYLYGVGMHLRHSYEQLSLDEPDYIDLNLKSLKREIKVKTAEKLEAKRLEIRSRLESLKTPQEKKRELQAQLKEVEASLQEV